MTEDILPQPETTDEPQPAPELSSSDASAQDDGDLFSLEADDTLPPDSGEPFAEEAEAGEAFALDLPEGFEPPGDELTAIFSEQAKRAGLSNKSASAYISSVLVAQAEANKARLDSQRDDLIRDWGKDFQTNVRAARSFAVQLADRAGVPREVMKVFASPVGFRLLHALRSAVGEPQFTSGASSVRSNEAEAKEMISNPEHPLYAAMYDPAHPKHREANDKYNRLVGLR